MNTNIREWLGNALARLLGGRWAVRVATGRPPRRAMPRVEFLETREVLSGYAPTAAEQLFLERLNDARSDPAAYGTNIGVDLSYIAPSQPLAFDTRLIQAARDHSRDLNDRGYFAHDTPEGVSPGDRMSAAGFPWNGYSESIAAGTWWTPESALSSLIIDNGVPGLGHRNHLLANGSSAAHKAVGVGIVQNGSGPYSNYFTIDSASESDTRPYLTGVVYNDANRNDKYDLGEGLGGVTVGVAGAGSVTTWDSGGYSLRLNSGTYTVTFSGVGLVSPVSKSVTVGSANYRLNVTPSASVNRAPDLSHVADQTMTAGQTFLVVTLSATDADGDALTYSAVAVSQAYELDQSLGLSSTGNYYQNYGGADEKWLLGSGNQWYFVTPNGSLYRWDGQAYQASGSLVATLGASYWSDPSTLSSATSGTPATVSVSGDRVTIAAPADFVGSFLVRASVSDGQASDTESFLVTRSGVPNNQPPILGSLADQTMAASAGSTTIALSASDADGDTVTFSALARSYAYTLDQQLGLHSDGNLYLNWGGRNEKWMKGNGGQWYFIVPDGGLFRWDGSTQATGTFVARVDTSYWSDPTLLFNATATAVPATVTVSAGTLTVQPMAGFFGTFVVEVMASDGKGGTDTKSFLFTVV